MIIHTDLLDPETPDTLCVSCEWITPLWDVQYLDDEAYCPDCAQNWLNDHSFDLPDAECHECGCDLWFGAIEYRWNSPYCAECVAEFDEA